MNPVAETRFIVQRELRKSFRSIKGIILTLLTVAGGGGLALLLAQSDAVRQQAMHEENVTSAQILAEKQEVFGWWFMDRATGEHVGHAPFVLVFLFGVSIVLMPAIVLLLGFDSISAERQYKTVRYWTVRSRRSSYVLGKWLGLWTTCAIVALGMHVLIWLACVIRGEAGVGEIVSWGFRLWLSSLPILAVWCAVSVLVSSLIRVPILALLGTASIFFVWWLFYIVSWFGAHVETKLGHGIPATRTLCFIFPNFYDRFILSPQAGPFLTGLALLFGFAALLLAISSTLFAKRDV